MKQFLNLVLSVSLLFFSFQNNYPQNRKEYLSGADALLRFKPLLLRGKNIGVVANHTAILKNGTHLIDSLIHMKDVHIIKLFSPEHGIRGDAEAGASVKDGADKKTGLKIISLYGKSFKPKKEDLKGINLILFDIQDIGARYYTYIATLYYVIEACAENNIPIFILDRPNPISPVEPDGPVIVKGFSSPVSIAPLPIIHNMTIGEIGKYFNYLFEKEKGLHCHLMVIPMKGWNRNRFFDEYSTNWVRPSPNITSLETALIYPGTCLIEGTNISEGRGTESPFLSIGAPFIKSSLLMDELNKHNIQGIAVEPFNFTPEDIPGTATNPKYKNELCRGIKITITDRKKIEPLKFGIALLYSLKKQFAEFKFKDKTIDMLFGNDFLRKMINAGEKPEKIYLKWQKELNNFINLRNKFLLYNK